MNQARKLKDIYGISFNLSDIPKEDYCPMHEWHYNLINKTYEQLDLFDVTRMIIQKIFIEMAVTKSVEFIKENPFCGQRYEGELLELLFRLDMSYLENYIDILKEVLSKALLKNQYYDWLCDYERIEFNELLVSCMKKIECHLRKL